MRRSRGRAAPTKDLLPQQLAKPTPDKHTPCIGWRQSRSLRAENQVWSGACQGVQPCVNFTAACRCACVGPGTPVRRSLRCSPACRMPSPQAWQARPRLQAAWSQQARLPSSIPQTRRSSQGASCFSSSPRPRSRFSSPPAQGAGAHNKDSAVSGCRVGILQKTFHRGAPHATACRVAMREPPTP